MQRMQTYVHKFAFVFRDSRAALDSPMMRLGGRSTPLFVRAGGQSGNHLGNQAREGGRRGLTGNR